MQGRDAKKTQKQIEAPRVGKHTLSSERNLKRRLRGDGGRCRCRGTGRVVDSAVGGCDPATLLPVLSRHDDSRGFSSWEAGAYTRCWVLSSAQLNCTQSSVAGRRQGVLDAQSRACRWQRWPRWPRWMSGMTCGGGEGCVRLREAGTMRPKWPSNQATSPGAQSCRTADSGSERPGRPWPVDNPLLRPAGSSNSPSSHVRGQQSNSLLDAAATRCLPTCRQSAILVIISNLDTRPCRRLFAGHGLELELELGLGSGSAQGLLACLHLSILCPCQLKSAGLAPRRPGRRSRPQMSTSLREPER